MRPIFLRRQAAVALAVAAIVPAAADQKTAPPPETHHEAKPVLFSADEVTYDEQLDIVTARGNVELSQQGRTLLADMVSYNQRSDTVIATGHVSLIEDMTGATTFGNYVELHDNMRDGFIKDVRVLLEDRTRLAGNAARRTDGNRTEMVRGVYSPCDLCQTDPTAAPLWQIRAARIEHDREDQNLEFYDATIDIDGIPAIWLPYLSHPDPTVRRRSGLLPSSIGNNTVLGPYVLVPYFWVLGDDKDLTTTILATADQGTMFEPEYRQRFDNGFIDLIGGLASSDPSPSPTGPANPSQLRGYFFGNGVLDINENLRGGFNVERTSDIVFLSEYKIGAYQNFLRSNVNLEYFDGRDYGSVYNYAFQSLQGDVENRIQAVVLPVVDYTWAGKPFAGGGQFTTSLDLLDLVRETGSSDRRASLGTEFDYPFTAFDGQRFNLLAAIRGDFYYASSLPTIPETTDTERVFPQVGIEWRYPWAMKSGASTWLIEPRAAFYAAPIGLNPQTIPNDDSGAVDFNDADLFSHNRFAGFDQVDTGQRVDYGLHLAWSQMTGQHVDFLAGQSYRFQQQSPFAVNGTGDGLERQASDYVGRLAISPGGGFDIGYHFRFAETDLRPQRQELSVSDTFGPLISSVNYGQIGNNFHDVETARQQISARFDLKIGTYWGAYVSGTRDITGDGHLLAAELGARYVDECTSLVGSIGTDGYLIGTYKPGTTVLLQLVLKNLGVINLPVMETVLGQ
jgi:LPS-assembly protein